VRGVNPASADDRRPSRERAGECARATADDKSFRELMPLTSVLLSRGLRIFCDPGQVFFRGACGRADCGDVTRELTTRVQNVN
jgi:hypothetical protein